EDAVHRREEEAPALVERASTLVARLRREDLVEQRDALRRMRAARPHRREALLGREILAAEDLAEVAPPAVGLRHGEGDPAIVLAAVVIPERVEGRAAGEARHLAAE